jgi:hypothetical protein
VPACSTPPTHTHHTHTEEEEEDEEYKEEDDNADNNIDTEDDSYYQVKAVLDHRLGAAGLLEFRICWAGFAASEDTWELLSHVTSCPVLLEHYLQQHLL